MRNVRTAVLLLVSACGSGGTTLPPPEPLEIWTKVTGGPTAFGLSSDTTPTIELASNLPDALFEVSLDGGPSRLVASPYTLTPLADGPHRLEAYASDGLGTRDLTPVSRSWVTDTVPPAVAATFPPPLSATTEARVAVCGTASDDRKLGSVSVNGVSAFSTDGFRTWRAVVPVTTGMNDLRLEATDAAGNRIDVPGS